MSNSFVEHAKAYHQCHKEGLSRYLNYVGIPLLFFSIIIFLGFIRLKMPHVFEIDFGWIASLVLFVYYLKLDWRLGLASLPFIILFNIIADFFSGNGISSSGFWTVIILFVVGAALVAVGHLQNKNRGSSANCVSQLLVAPLILIADIFFYFGKFYDTHKAIFGHTKK